MRTRTGTGELEPASRPLSPPPTNATSTNTRTRSMNFKSIAYSYNTVLVLDVIHRITRITRTGCCLLPTISAATSAMPDDGAGDERCCYSTRTACCLLPDAATSTAATSPPAATAYTYYRMTASRWWILPTAYCLLPVYCLLPILPTAYCLLPTACCLYCLLPTACCLQYCLLPPTACCGCLLPILQYEYCIYSTSIPASVQYSTVPDTSTSTYYLLPATYYPYSY